MFQAGQKVVWTIDFQPSYSRSAKPEISFITKNPIKLLRPTPSIEPMRDKAQDFLNRIQAMCSKITDECNQAITDNDYLKQSRTVSKDLGELDKLISELNKILEQFKPPETGEKKDNE